MTLAGRSPARPRLAAATAAVFLIVLTVFLPAIRNGWTNWDDPEVLLEHAHWRGCSLANLRWMWTTFHMGHYQPLTWMSYALDHALWGVNAAGVHLTNVVLHALAAALLVGAASRLLRRLGGAEPDGDSVSLATAAAIGALVWALHPMRVEVVAWATARRDVLSGFCLAASVFVWLGGDWAANGPTARRRWAAGVWWLAALLSKGQAMVYPALLALMAAALSGDAGRRWWAGLGPFWVVAAAFAVVAAVAARTSGAMLSLAAHGWMDRAVQAGCGLALYAARTLAPFRLSPLYPLPRPWNPFDPACLGPALAVAAAAMATPWLWRRRRRAAAALGWAVVALAPVLGWAQSGPQLAADRYTYVAAWPLAVAVAWPLNALMRRAAARGPEARPALAIAAAAALTLLGAFAALSRQQIGVWKDSATVWRHVVALYPNSAVARNNLAHAAEEAGDIETAREQYELAIAAEPLRLAPRAGLATLLARIGDCATARQMFESVLRMDPQQPAALLGRANLDLAEGRTRAAIEGYRAALAARPEFPDAEYNLATALLGLGEAVEARERLERVVRVQPEHAPAWHNLGIARQRLGDVEGARAAYARAVELDPAALRLHHPGPTGAPPASSAAPP